jgi:hypothetical protein
MPVTHETPLHPHAGCTQTPTGQIEARLTLNEDSLQFVFLVQFKDTPLRLPPLRNDQALGQRRDGLWQRTCCEAFIAATGQPGYLEFNFAPDGDWACYAFADYRQAITQPQQQSNPLISCQKLADGFRLSAQVDRKMLPDAERWDIALSVVLEEESGHKTYWALQHDTPQPDFHRRACFTLSLP